MGKVIIQIKKLEKHYDYEYSTYLNKMTLGLAIVIQMKLTKLMHR